MIDWTKPVRTKGNKSPVKILSIDGPGQQSVVGFLEPMKGADIDRDVYQWYPGGGFNVDPLGSSMDLENVPEPKTFSVERSGGETPRASWCWKVLMGYGGPQRQVFAVCESHDAAETIMHLLNGSK